MSKKGYIVVTQQNGPLELVKGDECGSRGVLYLGTKITVFKTRQGARAAIKRTLQYAKDRGFDSPWWTQHYIKPLAPKAE